MSLIGEALKRARLEAARREGEERGSAHSSVPAYLPARRQSRVGVVAIAVVLASLAGAGVVYLLVRPPSPTESRAASSPPIQNQPLLTPTSVPTTGPTPPTAAAETPPSSRAEPPALSEVEGRERAAASAEVDTPHPGPSTNAREEAVKASPPTPASPPGGKVYVTVAQLGATRLELDGIVASPTDPVAMINRKLLGIGEGLDGWVVEKIEAKQVTLRGGSQTIVLRLR